MIFYALFYVSFVGIVLGPVLATVASTLGIHEMVNLKKNKFAVRESKRKVKSTTVRKTTRVNKPKGQVEDDWS